MSSSKQVEASHYAFSDYVSLERWSSLWHQLKEVSNLGAESVLEIGPGPGLFKTNSQTAGLTVETLDIDPALNPDHLGSASQIPLADGQFEAVCAFQVLEHLPYEEALKAFNEMVRVSRRFVVISLPDARSMWQFRIHIPAYGPVSFLIPKPRLFAPEHIFDGEHYWEINKKHFPLQKLIEDFSQHANLEKTYRIFENPYHRMFVFSTKKVESDASK